MENRPLYPRDKILLVSLVWVEGVFFSVLAQCSLSSREGGFWSVPGFSAPPMLFVLRCTTAGLPVRRGFIISSGALGIFLNKRHLFTFKGDFLPSIPRLNWNKININDINRLSLKAESREYILFLLVVFTDVLLQWPQRHPVQPLWWQETCPAFKSALCPVP